MSPWKKLTQFNNFSLLGLRETLEGGQCFSWFKTSNTSWLGSFNLKVVELKFEKKTLFWRTCELHPATKTELLNYLWLDSTYNDAIDQLPWRSDSILAKCISKIPGLTILRQSLDETLFYFLLSSAKSIPQIKEMGFLVCQKWGKKLNSNIWSFPGWAKLGEASENDLRELKLGYRARYIYQIAQIIGKDPDFLYRVSTSTYEDAKSALVQLPGVGPKIADCALLFGANKTEAFPVDTWISKVLEDHYDLKSFNTKQKVLFAKKHFGKFAGLAQQFLFSGVRLGLIKEN